MFTHERLLELTGKYRLDKYILDPGSHVYAVKAVISRK